MLIESAAHEVVSFSVEALSVIIGEQHFYLPIAPLAQLDRASGYEPEGREFESLRAHHFLRFSPFTQYRDARLVLTCYCTTCFLKRHGHQQLSHAKFTLDIFQRQRCALN